MRIIDLKPIQIELIDQILRRGVRLDPQRIRPLFQPAGRETDIEQSLRSFGKGRVAGKGVVDPEMSPMVRHGGIRCGGRTEEACAELRRRERCIEAVDHKCVAEGRARIVVLPEPPLPRRGPVVHQFSISGPLIIVGVLLHMQGDSAGNLRSRRGPGHGRSRGIPAPMSRPPGEPVRARIREEIVVRRIAVIPPAIELDGRIRPDNDGNLLAAKPDRKRGGVL